MNSAKVVSLLLVLSLTAVVSGQTNELNGTTPITCGVNTELDGSTNECICIDGVAPDDPSRIYIAGLMDETAFPWCRDLFEFTVEQINQGRWGALNKSQSQYLEYSFGNEDCEDVSTVLREYWNLRTENGNKVMDGVVGCRCSGPSLALARITGKSRSRYSLLKWSFVQHRYST
jgi:hypothetical protein